MHAIVCIKQVPDTQEIRIDFDAGVIKRDGVPLIINPFDEYALEEALRLKEKHGGKVTVVTMGAPAADEALRTALAMGCDAAVLLNDAAFGDADTWVTATALAAAVRKIGDCDLVLFGKQTFDGDTGMVAPRVAALLGFPILSYVAKVEAVDPAAGTVAVERLLEAGRETCRAPLPAVISVIKEINEPRYPSLMGKRKAKSVDIPTWDAAALGVGGTAPLSKVARIYRPAERAGGETVEGEPADVASKVAARLAEQGLI